MVCHFSAVQTDGYRSLKEGESVKFDIVQGSKGPQAGGVIRVDPSPRSLVNLIGELSPLRRPKRHKTHTL